MRTEVTSDPVAFRAAVFPFLERDPVRHSVMLSNVDSRAGGSVVEPRPSTYLAVRDDAGEVVGAAMRTAFRGAYLSALTDEQVPLVTDLLAELMPDLDEAEATASGMRIFADRWRTLRGAEFRLVGGSRLMKLGELVPPPAAGTARRAGAPDVDLCVGWLEDFRRETALPDAVDRRTVGNRVGAGRMWLWEDAGVPVSLVGHQATLFGSTRVGPVYTPTELRGRGYASALTAYVSGRLREGGSEVCLYTDLANPTSNKIYAAIGYRPVADFVQYAVP